MLGPYITLYDPHIMACADPPLSIPSTSAPSLAARTQITEFSPSLIRMNAQIQRPPTSRHRPPAPSQRCNRGANLTRTSIGQQITVAKDTSMIETIGFIALLLAILFVAMMSPKRSDKDEKDRDSRDK
jgi:hypothetical protein